MGKSAQNLASKLDGIMFDVYMRLPITDKKNFDKVKSELLKEFEKGNQNREMAMFELNSRKRKPDKSVQTFAYKILELVKLVYPAFNDEALKVIAKDYFLKGLHQKMQIALTSLQDFEKTSMYHCSMNVSCISSMYHRVCIMAIIAEVIAFIETKVKGNAVPVNIRANFVVLAH